MMNQRGATIVESMVCMLLLCGGLFLLLQVFQWTMAKMICEYSSFYATKASSYGFDDTIVVNAARVAATAASGKDTGTDKEPLQSQYGNLDDYRRQLAIRAQNYMVHSDTNINYEYWVYGASSTTPVLYVPLHDLDNNMTPTTTVNVSILNMPFLVPALNNVGSEVNIPAGTSSMYNHALNYLDR